MSVDTYVKRVMELYDKSIQGTTGFSWNPDEERLRSQAKEMVEDQVRRVKDERVPKNNRISAKSGTLGIMQIRAWLLGRLDVSPEKAVDAELGPRIEEALNRFLSID